MTDQEYQTILTQLAELKNQLDELKQQNAVVIQAAQIIQQNSLLERFSQQDEKFATINELHRVFAQKFAEYDRRMEKPKIRPSRRPV